MTKAVPEDSFSTAAGWTSDILDQKSIHDCWSQIGVEGNATCRELARHIHCRNCPVFSATALTLLDRPISADYRRERSDYYARTKQITRPAWLSLVIFRLAREWFALPALALQEVAEYRVIHSLPRRRSGLVLGLVNVRGELLICVSAGRLLGVGPEAANLWQRKSFRRLLVTIWEGQRLVFPVDEAHGVERFSVDDIKASPANVARSSQTYTRGIFNWREEKIGLLEAQLFFDALNRNLS